MDFNTNCLKTQDWLEKRREILERDNYTCQLCQNFNPTLGEVTIYHPKDSSFELHCYESNPSNSIYRIESGKYEFGISIDFGQDRIVMPTLQVHHKRYYQNRKCYDYQKNDLITLCSSCHKNLHTVCDIPIYDDNGRLVTLKKLYPMDIQDEENTSFKTWTFFQKHNDIYTESTKISPTLHWFEFEYDKMEEIQTIVDGVPQFSYVKQDIKGIANSIYSDFMNRYLPRYLPKSSRKPK